MKNILRGQDDTVSEVVCELKQFVYSVLQDPIIYLARPIIKLIMDYIDFTHLQPEHHHLLSEELDSNYPDQKKLTKIFSNIDILNLQDLDLNISYPSLRLMIKLLAKNKSISAFIFKNTRLQNRDGNQIIYIINSVLEKRPLALSSLFISESKPQPLTLGAELLLLRTLAKNSLTSLSLINIPVSLSKLLKTVSNNLSISSLTVDNTSIELLPTNGIGPTSNPENFQKLLRKITLCKALSFVSISRLTSRYSFPNSEGRLENFNKILADHQDDITQILHKRIKQAFDEYGLTPLFPTTALDLMLNYISYNQKSSLVSKSLLWKELNSQSPQTHGSTKSNSCRI